SQRSQLEDNGGSHNSQLDDVLEQAYSAPSKSLAIQFANRAIELDPNCVEAYMLKCNLAPSIKEAIKWAEEGVQSVAQQLGSTYFKENKGLFWGLHETRPYMFLLAELGSLQTKNNQLKKAISSYEQLLDLNPNDNQGIRHSLLPVYLQDHQYQNAQALLDQYIEDKSAFMCFNAALLSYVTTGDTTESKHLRKTANSYNKYVAKYLSGKLKMPQEYPEYYGVGDKNEAIQFTSLNLKLWRSITGLIPWLLKSK
ncbi:MAG: hypothetical protein ACPGPF_07760, partial [Pontibacterium sp.]